MKNIMIFGICRTGKTTFSRMIQENFENYQIIEVDTIISAWQRIEPNVQIGFIHDNVKENKLPQFLSLLIEKNVVKNGKYMNFVINGDSIMPHDLIKYFNLENTIVYYFVNSKLTPEEILENCRKYDDSTEWTNRRTDEQILNHMKFYKDIEKQIIEECDKYKINCIDTSENRQEIFEKLIQDIRKEIQ